MKDDEETRHADLIYRSVFSLSASDAGSENRRTISSRALQLRVFCDTTEAGESGRGNGVRQTSWDDVPTRLDCTMESVDSV